MILMTIRKKENCPACKIKKSKRTSVKKSEQKKEKLNEALCCSKQDTIVAGCHD